MLSKPELEALQKQIAKVQERMATLPTDLKDKEKPNGLATLINARIIEVRYQLETLQAQIELAKCGMKWQFPSDNVVIARMEE